MSARAIEGEFKRTTWPEKPLGEVCSLTGGGTPSKKRVEFWGGDIPWVSPKDMKSDVITTSIDKITSKGIDGSAAKLIPRDAILVVVRSGILARTVPTAIAGCELTVNQDIKAILPSEYVLPTFLALFLQAAEPTLLRSVTKGATVHRLSTDTLKTLPIPLPPLEEQKRIVALLDQAFAALDRARALVEANLADAEDLLSSFIETELEKTGGDVLTLQEMMDSGLVISHLDGNHGSKYPRKEEFVEAGIAYISANCIVGSEVDLAQAKFLTPERAAAIKKGVAQDGDVIFAHNATVGPIALLNTDEEKVILSTSVTYYRPDPDRLLPRFLMYEMRGAAFRKQYEAVMKQATRNQVPITTQRKLTHTIPSVATQAKVVARASRLEVQSQKLREAYTTELSNISELRQSLLQKAFAGELA